MVRVMPDVRDIGEAIKAAAASGGQRVSIGGNPTFGQRTVPTLMPALVAQAEATSLSFSSVDVTASGSAALVAAGAPKPAVGTVTITPRQIQKVAGIATANAEAFWESQESIAVIISTLLASCVVEQDSLANAALAAAAADPVPQASWVEAISLGQATVAAAGGSPNLVVIPSASWPAVAAELAASSGLTTPSADAVASVLGSRKIGRAHV